MPDEEVAPADDRLRQAIANCPTEWKVSFRRLTRGGFTLSVDRGPNGIVEQTFREGWIDDAIYWLIRARDDPKTFKLATDLPHEYLAFIGAITVNFAALESALAFAIWTMLGDSEDPDPRFAVVTGQLSFKQLVWMHTNLYRQCFEETAEQAERTKDFVARLFKAEANRNQVAHSTWAASATGSTAERLKITARAEGAKAKFEDFSKEQLAAIANECEHLAMEAGACPYVKRLEQKVAMDKKVSGG